MLRERTGEDVGGWNQRIAGLAPASEQALREWPAGQGVTGYPQALLVWEHFGYPDFLTADADTLIAAQYADRPHLRPVLEALPAALPALGPVTIQARKTYVSLVSPRRTFAVVQASTGNRVDLGPRLATARPGGRLLGAPNVGTETITVRIALPAPEDLDEEALGWLRQAYEESLQPGGTARPGRAGPAPGYLPGKG